MGAECLSAVLRATPVRLRIGMVSRARRPPIGDFLVLQMHTTLEIGIHRRQNSENRPVFLTLI